MISDEILLYFKEWEFFSCGKFKKIPMRSLVYWTEVTKLFGKRCTFIHFFYVHIFKRSIFRVANRQIYLFFFIVHYIYYKIWSPYICKHKNKWKKKLRKKILYYHKKILNFSSKDKIYIFEIASILCFMTGI